MSLSVTGSNDTDYYLMLRLPDQDLTKVCQASKRYSAMCNSEYFWQQRSALFFADVLDQKKPNETWQSFYQALANPKRPIRIFYDNNLKVDKSGHPLKTLPVPKRFQKIAKEGDILTNGKDLHYIVGFDMYGIENNSFTIYSYSKQANAILRGLLQQNRLGELQEFFRILFPQMKDAPEDDRTLRIAAPPKQYIVVIASDGTVTEVRQMNYF